MWEEGAHIYGTPGVHNNFPCNYRLMVVIYIVMSVCYVNMYWVFNSLDTGLKVITKDPNYNLSSHFGS